MLNLYDIRQEYVIQIFINSNHSLKLMYYDSFALTFRFLFPRLTSYLIGFPRLPMKKTEFEDFHSCTFESLGKILREKFLCQPPEILGLICLEWNPTPGALKKSQEILMFSQSWEPLNQMVSGIVVLSWFF